MYKILLSKKFAGIWIGIGIGIGIESFNLRQQQKQQQKQNLWCVYTRDVHEHRNAKWKFKIQNLRRTRREEVGEERGARREASIQRFLTLFIIKKIRQERNEQEPKISEKTGQMFTQITLLWHGYPPPPPSLTHSISLSASTIGIFERLPYWKINQLPCAVERYRWKCTDRTWEARKHAQADKQRVCQADNIFPELHIFLWARVYNYICMCMCMCLNIFKCI